MFQWIFINNIWKNERFSIFVTKNFYFEILSAKEDSSRPSFEPLSQILESLRIIEVKKKSLEQNSFSYLT